jgi:Zn-dependent protease
MRPTVRLGQYAGIDIGLHWSIAVIAALLTITLGGSVLPQFAPGYGTPAYLVAALATGSLFLISIVAHELGHSLVALRNGVKVKGITLFALGGVATLGGEPSNAGAAARIALAGPAVSVGVAAIGLGGGGLAAAAGLPTLLVASLVWLGVVNLTLALFNLLPALPLDGGRLLQAYLWHRNGDRHGATIAAARLGRWLGWAMVAFGFWELSQGANGLLTMLIGWFVVGAAKSEAQRAQAERQLAQGGPPFPFGGFPEAEGVFGPRPSGQTPFPDGSFGPPSQTGLFRPGSWAPPRAEDRHPGGGPVIDVDGYPVGGGRR